MMRVFITGSSDGIGLLAARSLVEQGHNVTLHARNEQRRQVAMSQCPGAEDCVVGDLSIISEVKSLANKVNELETFDAIIHNAGMSPREPARGDTVDGLPPVVAVNSIAPYILSCLLTKPKRLVYVSSGLHTSGDGSLQDLAWKTRKWSGMQAYSDTKLHNVLLANAMARRFKGTLFSNSVSPGWVATKMGGQGATDDLQMGAETQAWLAVSDDEAAKTTGKYWFHKEERAPVKVALDEQVQDAYLQKCEEITGVTL